MRHKYNWLSETTSAMSEVARLYRQLVRVAARWPVDVARRNRDLGEHVRQRVQADFRQSAQLRDPEQIAYLLQLGRAELDAMKKLRNNFYKTEV